jgi:DNA-binding CsgD family transcriptional regulator
VQLLALARPHLIQAYRNAELRGARAAMLAALEEGLDTLGRHVIVLDPQGRLEFATDGARRLLGEHPTRSLSAVNEWIAARPEPHAAAEPLLLSGADRGLLVRVLPGRRADRRQVLLLEGDAGTLSSVALRGLGLTPREADTLRLVALGRSPAEAAGELGVARRTVDKHLQNVYAKLGTPSLASASR